MRYELNLVQAVMSWKLVFYRTDNDQRVEIDLGEGAVLFFPERRRDGRLFSGFSTCLGTRTLIHVRRCLCNYVELNYLDLAVARTTLLVCSSKAASRPPDRGSSIRRSCHKHLRT